MRCELLLAIFASAALANAQELSSIHSREVRQCATCHPAQAKPHAATSMAHAMELPAECVILKAHRLLTFTDGPYKYQIERKGNASFYTVSNGNESITVPIGWAFGLGRAGQTYVFEKDGTLYESRVSFYSSLNGLDLTMGASNFKPTNIVEAAGRAMVHAEEIKCFGCHSTDGIRDQKLDLASLTPGVQCERCHGSAENHLKGVTQGNPGLMAMKDLRKMSSEDVSNFCGQCHRTWDEIAGSGVLGIANIRFQPYRLTSSKCYDSDDARIKCVACHDPHRELDETAVHYDAKCQACHAGGKAKAQACSVSTSNCVTCHMPKLEMPGSHHKFTDHDIRVVRANAPYPN